MSAVPPAGLMAAPTAERQCVLGCGPLTGGIMLRDNRFGIPGGFRVDWCPVCGLGSTALDETDVDLSRLYEEHYAIADEDELRRVPRSGPLAALWHRLNGSLPLTDRGLRGPVLDVGSHTGETMLALRRRGVESRGIEPNPRAAAIARSNGLDVIESPIESAELEPGHYATIICSQILEHVRDPRSVLTRLVPALARHGVIYIVVPNADSIYRHLYGADWIHWHVPFHLYHFTRTSLCRLLALSGLVPRRISTVTPGEWLIMSAQARRNRKQGCYAIDGFTGRYAARAAVAPAGRAADLLRRGDAFVVEAVRA